MANGEGESKRERGTVRGSRCEKEGLRKIRKTNKKKKRGKKNLKQHARASKTRT